MRAIKVLMITYTFKYSGGIETFIMNSIRANNPDCIKVDVLAHVISASAYIEEIEKHGGRVYQMPPFSLKNINKIREEYDEILSREKYDVVHCNMANGAFLYLKEAKKKKIPVRILHSHQDKASDSILHAIRNYPLLHLGKRYATDNVACSKNAGKFLFGKRQFSVLRNTIEYSNYTFDIQKRKKIREELHIKDSTIVYGHTGRLTKQKNQKFVLKVFSKLCQCNPDSKLLLIGDGEDHDILMKKSKKLGIEEKVCFLGERSDIGMLLQGMDVFIFPSIYEGLGISLLEAQVAKLLCFCSDVIPHEVKISNKLFFISLKKDENYWADTIYNNLKKYKRDSADVANTFDVIASRNVLKKYYEQCLIKARKTI